MYLNPQWRILTIGDGDLSFSHALCQRGFAKTLCATVYDSQRTLEHKYTHHCTEQVKTHANKLLFQFDATSKQSWAQLNNAHFDVVIFQFPLLSGYADQKEFEHFNALGGLNTLNRALLHQFLLYSARYALDPQGAGLCYITSKDVKPYSHWGLEHALCAHTPLHFIGEQPFDIAHFPGYKVRNVNRDKHVKDTQGITYTYALNAQAHVPNTHRPKHVANPHYCKLCRSGPFQSTADKTQHEHAKHHQHMQRFEQHWQHWLNAFHQ